MQSHPHPTSSSTNKKFNGSKNKPTETFSQAINLQQLAKEKSAASSTLKPSSPSREHVFAGVITSTKPPTSSSSIEGFSRKLAVFSSNTKTYVQKIMSAQIQRFPQPAFSSNRAINTNTNLNQPQTFMQIPAFAQHNINQPALPSRGSRPGPRGKRGLSL